MSKKEPLFRSMEERYAAHVEYMNAAGRAILGEIQDSQRQKRFREIHRVEPFEEFKARFESLPEENQRKLDEIYAEGGKELAEEEFRVMEKRLREIERKARRRRGEGRAQ